MVYVYINVQDNNFKYWLLISISQRSLYIVVSCYCPSDPAFSERNPMESLSWWRLY